jgi:hypothetical protein
MEPHPQLKEFLAPYGPEIQRLTFALRKLLTEMIPTANELIWDNYNAVAIAYAKSEKLKDAFCHLSVYSKHVNFGFNRGSELSNSQIKLEGKGKLIRHLKVTDMDSFPKEVIIKMIYEAIIISEEKNPKLLQKENKGKSIVMSISEKRRRPT